MKLAWRINKKPGEIKYFLVHVVEAILDPIHLAFPAFLDTELLKVLCHVLDSRKRIRVFYGEPVVGETGAIILRHHNGRFDLHCNSSDVQEGYLKCVKWTDVEIRMGDSHFCHDDVQAYYPVIKTINSTSGKHYDFRPEEIVRVEYSNKKDGGILWEHPCFHEWSGYGDSPNYPLIDKTQGEIHSIGLK